MRGSGRQVASDWVHIFTIKDGKVAAFDEFTDTARFAEAMRG
jgi:ketosteroid isomerase-like protein